MINVRGFASVDPSPASLFEIAAQTRDSSRGGRQLANVLQEGCAGKGGAASDRVSPLQIMLVHPPIGRLVLEAGPQAAVSRAGPAPASGCLEPLAFRGKFGDH